MGQEVLPEQKLIDLEKTPQLLKMGRNTTPRSMQGDRRQESPEAGKRQGTHYTLTKNGAQAPFQNEQAWQGAGARC